MSYTMNEATWRANLADDLRIATERAVRCAVANERQAIVDAIYSKFIGGASGDDTAVDIVEIIRKRNAT
jgi:hypothetical protein